MRFSIESAIVASIGVASLGVASMDAFATFGKARVKNPAPITAQIAQVAQVEGYEGEQGGRYDRILNGDTIRQNQSSTSRKPKPTPTSEEVPDHASPASNPLPTATASR